MKDDAVIKDNEAVYLINEQTYLHLRENLQGVGYEVFDKNTDMDENHYVLTLENQRRFLVFTYYRNNMDYSTDIVLHIGLSANT